MVNKSLGIHPKKINPAKRRPRNKNKTPEVAGIPRELSNYIIRVVE